MVKNCNTMSREDFLNYAAQLGKETVAELSELILLCDPDNLMKIMVDIKI